MKTLHILSFLFVSLFINSASANLRDSNKNDPNELFRESSSIIGNSVVYSADSTSSFSKNREVFSDLSHLINKVDSYSKELSDKIKSSISNGRVVNGEEVYQISSLMNIYHGISVRFNELNSYSKPNPMKPFLSSDDKVRMGKDLIWLATYSKLYTSFYNNYLNYYKHVNLRKIVKNLIVTKRESGQKVDELFALVSHILEKDNRNTMRDYLKKYQDFKSDYSTNKMTFDEEITFLMNTIDNEDVLGQITYNHNIDISNYTITDALLSFFGKVTNVISGVFGNLVGKIRWRHGYLYKDNVVKNDLLKHLQPLDILFEKTPFALTDTFIPGHFGHAALYLGTEEQLKELGIWDSKIIRPYQDRISKGEIIIEAIRPGVGLTTMDKFLEIDEIAIVRQKSINTDKHEMFEIYKRAMDQIGKDYDFNFDVETTDKIVCSELLFFAFGQINWPTVYLLGRPTISPDNLAELTFYENTPLDFVLNYWSKKKGTMIKGDIEDLAENIGYRKNTARSTQDKLSFDKKEYKCKTVFSKTLRSGSRRSKRIQRRYCGVVYVKKEYNTSENFRDPHNGYNE